MFSRIIIYSRNAATAANYTRRPTLVGLKNCSRMYHEKVLDHYEKPRNVGSLDKSNKFVGTGLVGAPACGDVMKLQIQVDPNTKRITDVKFKTFGWYVQSPLSLYIVVHILSY